jgi:hypothetical protein
VAALIVWMLQVARARTRSSPAKPLTYFIVCFLASVAGVLIAPTLVVSFFAFKGALPQMYYCVIEHNLTSGIAPLELMTQRAWDIRFWLFIPMLAGGMWMSKHDTQSGRGPKILFLLAVTGSFCPLLFTFWPLVSKQDFLPYYPLLMLAIAWPLVGLGEWIASITWWPIFLPPFLVVCWQVSSIVQTHPPFKQTNQKNEQIIADTLNLTQRGETVMDAKGQTIYRERAYYYVFEQLTRERVERGELLDDVPKWLMADRTPVVVESNWLTQTTGHFVNRNYVSVGSVLVLGMRITISQVRHVQFEVKIPEKYAIVGRHGKVSGTLDGTVIVGPRDLTAGIHDLDLNSPEDAVAIVWSRAIEKGYSPFGPASKLN